LNIKITILLIITDKMTQFSQKHSTGNYFDNVPGLYRHELIPAIYEQDEEFYHGGGEFYFYYETPYGNYSRSFHYLEDEDDVYRDMMTSPPQNEDTLDDDDEEY
jgi:hypothetical protein